MKYRTKLYLILVAVAFIGATLGLTISFFEVRNFALNAYRSKALSIAATTAALIDGDQLDTIKTIEDTKLPAYITIRDQLRSARNHNQRSDVHVIYMYILQPLPENKEQLSLLVTAANIPEETLPFGDIYESPRSKLISENTQLPFAPKTYVEDQWGKWLSGYAPIYDSNDQYVATLGIDISAEDIQYELYTLIFIALYSLGIALIAALIFAFFLSRFVTSSLSTLMQSINQIGEGNFDHKIELKTHDEFGELGKSINKMSAGLKERERLKLNFARYVSSYVLEKALSSDVTLNLEGERKKITVMFSDIRHFTNLSEKLNPEVVVSLLNEYFEKMIEIIFLHNGTLDKFLGDGIMIEFGTPIPDEEQEINAIKAAIAMQKEVEILSKKWLVQGKPQLNIGIGIHTGLAVVGNIGSEKRLEYTAIGDTVNVASRLQEATKTLNVPILVSNETYEGAKDKFTFESLGDVALHGREEKIKTFTPIFDKGSDEQI